MICTRTLTIDPPGTHSLLGIDILMRCNLDIDRSLCFPTAIQSKSATSTYNSSSWDRGAPVQGQFECRLETWFEMHILKESHHLAQHPFLFNSKFESQIKKLKKQLILIQFPMHGANAGWSPRMGTYRTGIRSSAACYKYLLEDSGRQKFLWIMNLLRLMDNNRENDFKRCFRSESELYQMNATLQKKWRDLPTYIHSMTNMGIQDYRRMILKSY